MTFTDGESESGQVPVQTLFQKVADVIRLELGVAATALTDPTIDFLIGSVKADVIPDICKFEYGVQLTKETDGIYRIPNRYYFDRNFGGAFSLLDFDMFRQEVPVTIYSEKIPVTPVDIDPENRFVTVDEVISDADVVKMTFYSIGRKVQDNTLAKLLAYKIATVHFDAIYAACASSSGRKVKIGDVTVENGVKGANVALDMSNKSNAKYRELVNKIKNGFHRARQ